MGLFKSIIEKFGFREITLKELDEKMKPNQRVGIRLDISPHTIITRIEDIDDETVHVAGINEQEIDFAMPVPKQKMELHIFSEKVLYKTEVLFERRVLQPIHMWVLSKPKKAISYQERRVAYRLDNALNANFKIQDQVVKQESEAVTRNVSIGGLAIVSSVNMLLGTKVEVRLSDINDMHVAAEVVWKYQRSFSDKWYYGLKFINITEDKESLLAKYINDKLAQLRRAGLE